jgi:serine/threonine protein kinase
MLRVLAENWAIQTNILIGDDHRALVADFGLAIVGYTTHGADTSTGTRGSTPWMAPERFGDMERRVPEMDVYSFGCICYMVGVPVYLTKT